MPYYIEQWRPRPKWLLLTPEDRGKFLFDLSPTIQSLIDDPQRPPAGVSDR
jgi:hypothetical protein